MTTVFARITDLHDQISFLINPCARLLYRWLLRRRPAGKEQEFSLSDFQDWTAQTRCRPYSERHVRRALTQLIDQGLLGQVKKYYSIQRWSVVAYHPDEPKVSDSDPKLSESDSKMSKTESSKPDSAVDPYREIKEITDTRPPHPAAVLNNFEKEEEEKNQGAMVSPAPERAEENADIDESEPLNSDESKLSVAEQSQKLDVIDDASIRLNAQLKALVRNFTLEEVKKAIAYYRQTKRAKETKGQKIDRPAGWLTECLRQRWWQSAEPEKTREEEEFEQWYKDAIAAGIVQDVPINYLGTNWKREYMVRLPKPNGLGSPYTLVSWRELL